MVVAVVCVGLIGIDVSLTLVVASLFAVTYIVAGLWRDIRKILPLMFRTGWYYSDSDLEKKQNFREELAMNFLTKNKGIYHDNLVPANGDFSRMSEEHINPNQKSVSDVQYRTSR